MKETMSKHIPVMVQEVIDILPEGSSMILDGTLGHGGHTLALYEHQVKKGIIPHIVGVDRDQEMLDKAKYFLNGKIPQENITYVRSSYADLKKISATGVKFDYILLDIGVNMDHFRKGDRGFSIKREGILDMRFDRSTGIPCHEWLRRTHFDELLGIFERYTDFSLSYREDIARSLLLYMKRTGIKTTQDMKNRALSFGLSTKNLAVLFQSRRIVINGELDELENFLKVFPTYLTMGGRCTLITYHSGEDRIVKFAFKKLVDNGSGVHYNKRVIKPTWKEVERNKPSRSAKIRAFEKI